MNLLYSVPLVSQFGRRAINSLMVLSILTSLMISCAPTQQQFTPGIVSKVTTTAKKSLAPTLTVQSTAAPTTTTSVLSPALQALPIGKISSIPFGKDRVNNLVIDDQYLYWVGGKDEADMFRMPIQGGKPEKVVSTTYAGGRLSLLNPIRSRKWLIFADTNTFNDPDTWKIRALNLEDRSEQLVLDIKNDTAGVIYSFHMAAAGDLLVWTLGIPETYEVGVWVLNLSTGEKRELLREKEGAAIWSVLAVSGNQAVIERDFDSGGNDLYLLDLASGATQPISTDGESSMPRFEYPWIMWKASHRYDNANKAGFYNVQTQKTEFVQLQGQDHDDPLMNGTRIYWIGWEYLGDNNVTVEIYVFDILKKTTYVLKSTGNDQRYDSVAIYGNNIAWVRLTNASNATPDSYLEWAKLP